MVETFTPAVCGSRRRQRIAVVSFALGAVAASALVGAALGALGQIIGLRVAAVAAGLALLAAAREAGLIRLPLPQSRRQVPERWRAELPLPVWSAGYGAGRAVMAVWPRRRGADPTAAVEELASRHGALLRANVAALVACAALLASAQAVDAAVVSMGPGLDPSVQATVLARAQMSSGTTSVSVEPTAEPAVLVPDAASPSVDGDLLAYADSGGIQVINWRTGEVVARVDGAVSRPALDWPLLAFIRTDSTYKHLILADFTNPGSPSERGIARTLVQNDLGRPSLGGERLAWHKTTNQASRITVEMLSTGRRVVIVRSRIVLEENPALSARRIVWVEQRPRTSALRMRRFDRRRVHSIYTTSGSSRLLWTTALVGRRAYVVRWSLATRGATLLRVSF